MSQPNWKYVGNLGDASPLEYGGFFVFVDKTGVYEPEAEIYDPDSHEAWRFTLEQYTMTEYGLIHTTLLGSKYLRFPIETYAWEEWWMDGLDRLCKTNDIKRDEMIKLLCSEDPMTRASAYRELASYHGNHNFDHYPLTLTEKEAKKRYKSLGVTNL